MNSGTGIAMQPSGWRSLRETVRHRRFALGLGLGLILLLGGCMGWVIYDARENQRLDAESVGLKVDLEVGFGEEARVSDFLEFLNGEMVDDKFVETTELGLKEVNFEYINVRGRKRSYIFEIEVVDKVAPVIYGVNAYTVGRGYEGDLTDLMLSGDDLDDHPVREVVGEYNLNKIGKYELEYVITDVGGNEARQNFVLNVVEPVAGGGGVTTTTTQPKYDFAEAIRDHKTAKTKVGIDVSSWQGEIDWRKVKEAGVEFAFIRLGYQVDYGGEYVVDKFFKRNIEGALEVGLSVGVYFYSYADSIEQARLQAEWVAEQVREYKLELGVAFDWEDWKNFNQTGMSFRTINLVAKEFLDVAAEHGLRGWLYGSKNYLEKIWQPEMLDGKSIWLAQYYDRVTFEGEYEIWQLSDRGRVAGIRGDVDIDVWYF